MFIAYKETLKINNMKISDLKEPIKSWAEENVMCQPDFADSEDEKDILIDAFNWGNTKEGYDFWYYVDGGMNLDELFDKFPRLPWNQEPLKLL
jgi:hypothetical protein